MLNVSSRCKFDSSVLQDYPEDDMEVEPSMCVSYAKSPYKKTRRSICKVTMVLDLITLLIYNILYTRYIIYIYIFIFGWFKNPKYIQMIVDQGLSVALKAQ